MWTCAHIVPGDTTLDKVLNLNNENGIHVSVIHVFLNGDYVTVKLQNAFKLSSIRIIYKHGHTCYIIFLSRAMYIRTV